MEGKGEAIAPVGDPEKYPSYYPSSVNSGICFSNKNRSFKKKVRTKVEPEHDQQIGIESIELARAIAERPDPNRNMRRGIDYLSHFLPLLWLFRTNRSSERFCLHRAKVRKGTSHIGIAVSAISINEPNRD